MEGWNGCTYCHAVTWNRWPHEQGKPCPMKEETERIYREKLAAERDAADASREASDVQRASAQATSMQLLDLGQMLRSLGRSDDD